MSQLFFPRHVIWLFELFNQLGIFKGLLNLIGFKGLSR
jgi:hypothetical protein